MGKPLTVFWIHGTNSLPSTRIRCHLVKSALKNEDIIIDDYEYNRKTGRIRDIAQSIEKYDIVILQKILLPKPELSVLRRASRKLIFDFDDAINVRQSPKLGTHFSFKRRWRLQRVLRVADQVIVGNRYLADTARSLGAQSIDELPSGVPTPNTFAKHRTTQPTFDDPLILGWIGTAPNQPYLNLWSEAFARLANDEVPIRLRIVSDRPPPTWGDFQQEYLQWSEETQDDHVASFDLGLMPLPDTPWTRGKCAYKALQSMAAEVPVLVSNVGVTSDWVGASGIAVDHPYQVVDFIKEIAKNPDKLKKMGEIGRQIVASRFDIDIVSERLACILKRHA